jgi:hypothetical protein
MKQVRTVGQLKELGIWEKVCKHEGWNLNDRYVKSIPDNSKIPFDADLLDNVVENNK